MVMRKPCRAHRDPPARQPTLVVIANTASHAGRELLRGVHDYTSAFLPDWRLLFEPEPAGIGRRPFWQGEVGFIHAYFDKRLMDDLLTKRLPIVTCTAHFEDRCAATVRTDDEAAGRLAAEHFLKRGFERFGFFSSGDQSRAAWLRWEGFRKRLAKAGHTARAFPADLFRQRHGRLSPEGLPAWLRDTLGLPSALFCSFDTAGRQASTDLHFAGLVVPEQVAMLGMDDDPIECELSQPPLSSIAVPGREIGFRAAQTLHGLVRGDRPPAGPVLLPPLGVTVRPSSDSLAVDDPLLARAAAYIRAHACDPCTVADVARAAGMSRRLLELHFRALRQTPHAAVMAVRLERACRLLRDPRLPIQTVAAQCGYDLLQNFGRAFRQAIGTTPAAYRRAHVAKA